MLVADQYQSGKNYGDYAKQVVFLLSVHSFSLGYEDTSLFPRVELQPVVEYELALLLGQRAFLHLGFDPLLCLDAGLDVIVQVLAVEANTVPFLVLAYQFVTVW